nr:hypothetical protein CFP56_19396 [Quercus suber]
MFDVLPASRPWFIVRHPRANSCRPFVHPFVPRHNGEEPRTASGRVSPNKLHGPPRTIRLRNSSISPLQLNAGHGRERERGDCHRTCVLLSGRPSPVPTHPCLCRFVRRVSVDICLHDGAVMIIRYSTDLPYSTVGNEILGVIVRAGMARAQLDGAGSSPVTSHSPSSTAAPRMRCCLSPAAWSQGSTTTPPPLNGSAGA